MYLNKFTTLRYYFPFIHGLIIELDFLFKTMDWNDSMESTESLKQILEGLEMLSMIVLWCLANAVFYVSSRSSFRLNMHLVGCFTSCRQRNILMHEIDVYLSW